MRSPRKERKLASLVIAASALTGLSLGQVPERVIAVSELNAKPLTQIEVAAGGVVRTGSVDLQSITPMSLLSMSSVLGVGDQTWVGTADGVFRYAGTPLTFVDRVLAGSSVTGLFPFPGGAYAQLVDGSLVEFDASGTQLGTATIGTGVSDLVAYQGGFLALNASQVLRLDSSLQQVGVFGPTLAADVAAATGAPFLPRRLDVLPDDRVVFANVAFVVIARADGTLQDTAQVGIFEDDVTVTGGGLVLVQTLQGGTLLDPDTLEVFDGPFLPQLNSSSIVAPRTPVALPVVSGRGCVTSPNSVGDGARIHLIGSADIGEQTLRSIATGLPASTFVLPILGSAATNVAYGDGRLCVSPFAPGIARGPVRSASTLGSATVEYDFATPGLGGSFIAGTTWHFQLLYRDAPGPSGAGFNGTDGAFVTF